MSVLPDELWSLILEIGTCSGSILGFRDLCCLSMSCRRLRRISDHNSLWSRLLSLDFPTPQHPPPDSKHQYQIRYERDREGKRVAHTRAVLRVEATISEHSRRIQEIKDKCVEESARMRNTQAELINLGQIRQASVALNVWQPEVIRGRQEHLVGQCTVDVDSRISSLEMELRLCRHQITGFEKAIKVERRRLESAKEQLASLQYHPLQGYDTQSRQINNPAKKRRKKAISVKEGLAEAVDIG